ncbi:error-prone DNA polymerase [Aestuariivirga sp.]|uniref:error-prone DNA polymerase n=1 Tax=Aestuariivirga sp. TaxID=2650926 RepID=UPI0039E49234
MTRYAELSCASNFSFLNGASHAEELVLQAKHLGLEALAVTDINTFAGVVRAHGAAKDSGLRFIVGVRLEMDGLSLLAWPTDRKAYGRLCRLLSLGQQRAEKGKCIISLDDVAEFSEGTIFALPEEHAARLHMLKGRLERLYLALSFRFDGRDRIRMLESAAMAREQGVPLLAVNNVLYHHPARRPLQDVITCIREKVTLADAGFRLQANAERHIKTPDEMARLFRDYPQAIANTIVIAGACTFSLDELRYEYPEEPVPKGYDPQAYLERLAWEGAKERYPEGIPRKIGDNIRKELALIQKLDYAPYFLTVYDIVRFARSLDPPILCQGRGSAANSTVCYCIGITAVDPNQIDLLFERFISEERKEPPDIDVDFEHERREEVIQYLYRRYGRDRAGLAATVITYRGRSAMREVGKVMGLSEDVTGALAGSVWGMMAEELQEKRLREIGLDPDDPHLTRVLELATEIAGFPRHLSQHVGGFILTRERLDETVPIGNAAMEDRTFIEWDKDDIDTLGMLKVDVLALGMLTCIRKSFDLIEAWYERRFTLATVPREDAAVYDMLCKADSIGVFQVESRAQMNMLPRLKPRRFYDLVIEVAIVRPGPIQGDMVHPYLRRRDGLEAEDYPAPHPDFGPPDELRQVLGRTKGVPLFQEQAMKLAMVAAEFTPAESNELRKALATFRRRGTIGRLEQKMVSRMVERGYDADFALRCFNQIKGFGEYGFPESHAASFAHLVYVSAWLKCHYPAVFACALLNSQPMGFYAPAQIVRDAREHGVQVLPVDVSFSQWDSVLEERQGQPAVRLGFREVDGLRESDMAILAQRRLVTADEHFRALPVPALEKLAAADCFRSLGLDRRQALWEVTALAKTKALPLFAFADEREHGREPPVKLPEMPLSEHVVNDYQTVKLSLKAHPMSFLRARCAAEKVTDNGALKALRNGRAVTVAGVVLVRQRPGSAKGVVFLTLEDEFSVCNVVIWPDVLEAHRSTVMGARLMVIRGRVQRAGDIIHVVASRIEDKTFWLSTLAEDGLTMRGTLARADEVKRPGPDPAMYQQSSTRHPRNIRVLPKSRDFH